MSVDIVNPGSNGVAVKSTSTTITTSPGPAGRSAYELAVSRGFVGTLDEWLASLQGPEGAPGGDSLAFEFFQDTPSASWSITVPPGMDRRPNVSIYIDDEEVLADVSATSSSVNIVFPSPVVGSAVLS